MKPYILVLCVFGVARGQDLRWGATNLPKTVFVAAIQRLSAQSETPDGFETLKGSLDLSGSGIRWKGTYLLPGADACFVMSNDFYVCDAQFQSLMDATRAAEQIAPLIEEALHTRIQPIFLGTSFWSVLFNGSGSRVEMVRIGGHTLALKIIGRKLDLPANHNPYPKLLSSESPSSSSEVSGSYSPLPPVVRGEFDSTLAGRAIWIVKNETDSELRIVLKGLTQLMIVVDPKSSRSIDVAPGRYEVLGDLQKRGVRPFRGVQEYMGNYSHSSVFYIRSF